MTMTTTMALQTSKRGSCNKPFSDWQTAVETWHHATRQDVNLEDAVMESSDGRLNKRIDVECCSAFHTCHKYNIYHE